MRIEVEGGGGLREMVGRVKRDVEEGGSRVGGER